MAIPVYPRPEERTCRGKAGKSKVHPHYAGRAVVYVAGAYTTRCTSCGQVIRLEGRAGYQPVPEAELPALALKLMRIVL